MLTLILCALLILAVSYVFFVAPLWFLPVLECLTPGVLYRVHMQQPLVGLSFDDGPHPEFTPRVLEILQQHGARATFFLIGERAVRFPDLLQAIRAQDHEIGNHCWKDGSILGLSNEQFTRSLEATEQVLQRRDLPAGGHPQRAQPALKLFRAPGGAAWPRQWRLARERRFLGVLGCAYPHDPMRPPVWYIRWLIAKNLRPGSIVILHDGIENPSKTIAALPAILQSGQKRGFQFVTVGELIRASRQQND